VTLPLPSDSCMTTVLPFGHFGPSSTYASTREGREAPKTTNRATSVVKGLARRDCCDIRAALSGLIISMIPRKAKSVPSTPAKPFIRKIGPHQDTTEPRVLRRVLSAFYAPKGPAACCHQRHHARGSISRGFIKRLSFQRSKSPRS